MASSAVLNLACALFMCMLVAAPHAEAALTCDQVTKSLTACANYLVGKGSPTAACCSGVKSLNSMASSSSDRKTACTCLKSAAASLKGLKYPLASSLPGKCNVITPYPISTSVDCSKVH